MNRYGEIKREEKGTNMSIWNVLKIQRENEYKEYINNHIRNVHVAWDKLKETPGFKELLIDELHLTEHEYENMILILDHDIDQHDRSKWDREEFDAYRKEYYSITPEEKEGNKNDIERAWRHHYTHNHHHWNWYHENGCESKMPMKNVFHMVVDWEAMSYNPNNSSTKEWYNKNKKDIYLGEKQRNFAEKLMGLMNNK